MAVMVILMGYPWNIFAKLSGRSGINFPAWKATLLPVASFRSPGTKIQILARGRNATDFQGMLALELSSKILSAVRDTQLDLRVTTSKVSAQLATVGPICARECKIISVSDAKTTVTILCYSLNGRIE